MRKLRNIGYLRFRSKIRQGFAGGITSLTHPPSPLSGSRGQQMRAQGEGAEFYISGGQWEPAAPPAGRQAPCRQLVGRQGDGRLPPRTTAQIFFIYI